MHFPLPKAARLSRRRGCRAAILLEVILALVLFVTAAAVIVGGLNVSINAVDRLKLNTHAANLALSVASELQMGIRSPEWLGPEPFDVPFEEWIWELQITPLQTPVGEASRLQMAEVTVRHTDPDVVYRLTQVLPLENNQGTREGTNSPVQSQFSRYAF